jgi:hypothetical protein
MELKSYQISVFPASSRSDTYDRNARLTTEQNLVSIINRLTGEKSFIISGLNVEYDGSKAILRSGSANIAGYLFSINTDIDISGLPVAGTNNTLYFKISIKRYAINMFGDANVGSDIKSYVNELYSADETDAVLDTSENVTDAIFKGLELDSGDGTTLNDNEEGDIFTYYLKIAVVKDGKWGPIVASGIRGSSLNTLKFKADGISISPSRFTDIYYNQKQDLRTFLEYNYIIDDGEI